ncbi:hypothetical protein [Jidongwangia harbinensis]|uniref:hypothetical protein n=1 Tax=Jidongwangia harbinensis TaxID=2878561 RepID=UPI001CD9F11E|nr:hypothetical protein [Jidongwangia harbinensis]MCA2214044.1 hypothetical protein [Jidongwangia harbinensis]
MRRFVSRAGRCLAGLVLLIAAPAVPAVAATAGHRLSLTLIDRTGRPPADADTWVDLYDLATGEQMPFGVRDGAGTVHLPAGAYQAYGFVQTRDPDSVSTVVLPRIRLDRDTALVLDARTAERVDVRVDRPGARRHGGAIEFLQPTPGHTIRYAASLPADIDAYLTPTAAAPGLRARIYATLTGGGATTARQAYVVVRDLRDGVPPRLRFTARVRELAVRTVTVAGQGRPACATLELSATRSGSPWQYTERIPLGPPDRPPFTVAFSPGADPLWALTTEFMGGDCDPAAGVDRYSVNAVFRTAGTGTLAFGRAPLGPAVAHRQPGTAGYVFWADDTLLVRIPLFADAGPGHYSTPLDSSYPAYPYVTGETRLTGADGRLLYTEPRPGHCACHLPAGTVPDGPLRLAVDAYRAAPWSDLAVRQHIEWTFPADRERPAVPLLAVRYRAALDADGRAPGGAAFPLALWVERHDPASPAVATVRLEASFDDGATWSAVPLTGTGDARSGLVTHPASGYVSLRATAADTAGNRVDQTVIRAYGLTPPSA